MYVYSGYISLDEEIYINSYYLHVCICIHRSHKSRQNTICMYVYAHIDIQEQKEYYKSTCVLSQ